MADSLMNNVKKQDGYVNDEDKEDLQMEQVHDERYSRHQLAAAFCWLQ